MLTIRQAINCIKDIGRASLQTLLNDYGEDVVEAALECDIQPADIGESYQGEYDDDTDFTRQLLADIGAIPQDLPGYIHIDWDRTAKDIMMDYCEHNGHYFRLA